MYGAPAYDGTPSPLAQDETAACVFAMNDTEGAFESGERQAAEEARRIAARSVPHRPRPLSAACGVANRIAPASEHLDLTAPDQRSRKRNPIRSPLAVFPLQHRPSPQSLPFDR